MKKQFLLTYQTVTEESASYGDFAYHGFISRYGNFDETRNYMPKNPATFTLRDALRIFQEHGGNIQANEWPLSNPRWFDSCLEEYGGSVTIGLHLPDSLTPSTKLRIARYLGLESNSRSL